MMGRVRRAPKLLAPIGFASLLLALLLLLRPNAAQADEIGYSDGVPEQLMTWNEVISFPKFDPTLGILTRVQITLTGQVTGSLRYENFAGVPNTITRNYYAELSGATPDGTTISSGGVISSVTELLPAFDGTIDFAGTSGRTYPLSAGLAVSEEFVAPSDLAFYTGAGFVTLPMTATSRWDGSSTIANEITSVSSSASADAEILYIYAIPEVVLEKLTNGFDADNSTDSDIPEIQPGNPVTWTYIVTNTGVITIPFASVVVSDSTPGVTPIFVPASDDGDGQLAPGEAWTYIATGTAADLDDPGQTGDLTVVTGCENAGNGFGGARETYENIGYVAVPGSGDDDPSHYCNPSIPGIELKKYTNDADADDPDGADVPVLAPGDAVVWTYVVTNTGQVTFPADQVVVTDNIAGVTPLLDTASDDGADGLLSPGEVWIFTAQGTAADLLDPTETVNLVVVDGCLVDTQGQRPTYENVGTVVVPGATDEDPSHYCNPLIPGIDIEKATNGADADDPDSPEVPVLAPGDPVVWTYVVTNTGDVIFATDEVVVTDDIAGVTPLLDPASDDGGDGLLMPGEVWIFTAQGTVADLADPTAITGFTVVDGCLVDTQGRRPTYENVGTVVVPGAMDEDPSHYCNPLIPGIDIEKATNGADADGRNDGDVPELQPGMPVRWDYVVTNTGDVTFTLSEVVVTDSTPGVIPQFDVTSDDGDNLLSPGEVWRFFALGTTLDLANPTATQNVTIVNGCGIGGTLELDTRPTYENVGTVVVPGATADDPSHYCNPQAPTAIVLLALTANADDDTITLVWQTGVEENTVGFRLLRSVTGRRQDAAVMNAALVMAGAPQAANGTRTYRVTDAAVLHGVTYTYWLVEVDQTGGEHEFGPVTARLSPVESGFRTYLPLLLTR